MTEENLARPSEKRVLIVDDDAAELDVMTHVVQQEGFNVECATDGEKALEKVRARKPDLILLDLMLPRKGGYEVLRQLQNGDASQVPVIVVTGRNTDTTTAEMIRQETNVADFVTKPVAFGYLRSALHKVLKTQPPAKINRR